MSSKFYKVDTKIEWFNHFWFRQNSYSDFGWVPYWHALYGRSKRQNEMIWGPISCPLPLPCFQAAKIKNTKILHYLARVPSTTKITGYCSSRTMAKELLLQSYHLRNCLKHFLEHHEVFGVQRSLGALQVLSVANLVAQASLAWTATERTHYFQTSLHALFQERNSSCHFLQQ